jgi:uncharacterized protein
MRSLLTLDHLRRHAVARNFTALASLPRALARMQFVQADPIRAPARAQDLILRQRVADYRAGELEQRYPKLAVEEDFFVNYGFVSPELHRLMHPRTARTVWPASRWKQAEAVLAFVRERGVVHPQEVDAQFQHGKARNWFGGSSNVSTQLLDGMHYRGLLRVARREGGTRCYAARPAHEAASNPAAALDAMVDVIVAQYAPLPASTLSHLVMFLAAAAPQWRELRRAALVRARQRLPQATVEGNTWYWPEGENPARSPQAEDRVRLLAPFDPLVWDRKRFEIFWRWPYRFEAYTPAPKRLLGYYALPLLWRDEVVGWANVAVRDGRMQPEVGFFGPRIKDASFVQAMDEELHRLQAFLGLQ